MSDQPRCATCRWWDDFSEEVGRDVRLGSCRRHAPRPIGVTADDQIWPATMAKDWCGEHTARGPAEGA